MFKIILNTFDVQWCRLSRFQKEDSKVLNVTSRSCIPGKCSLRWWHFCLLSCFLVLWPFCCLLIDRSGHCHCWFVCLVFFGLVLILPFCIQFLICTCVCTFQLAFSLGHIILVFKFFVFYSFSTNVPCLLFILFFFLFSASRLCFVRFTNSLLLLLLLLR